jgi:mannose-6-phosphate isomerase-like protein (cupin superfamily)
MTTSTPTVIGPSEGRMVQLQTIGVRHMIPAEAAEGRFSLVEHPMPAKGLAAPLHRHNREDEYSFVLEGRMGALLGEDVVYSEPGDLVYKPRGQWHTFWNAGDEPARILEIISPAGFEQFFDELSAIVSEAAPDQARFGELCARYALDVDPDSVPGLCERFGLWFPMPS